MNTEELAVFAEVARAGSFAAVAKARNVAPSSISRIIANLEAALGVRLFQRTTRRMSLTPEGEACLARAVPLAEELDVIRAQMAQSRMRPSGTLRLSASVSFGEYCILPLLPRFLDLYPDVRVECVFTDANVDLVSERVDLAVRLAPVLEGDLVASKLMDTRYRVVASPEYIAREGMPEKPADLEKRDCVLFNLPGWQRTWRFQEPGGPAFEVPIRGRIVLSPAGALLDAARRGLGPALLADWLVASEMENGNLVDLFPRHEVAATSFSTAAWLVYPSKTYMPAKTRAAIDFLRDSLGR